MLIVFKSWPRQIGHLPGQISRQVGQSRNEPDDCDDTVHTFNMNIKSINNLELLLIILLKKETTLLDKFHRLIAYFKAP
jgi:hypothetical protein